MLFLNLAEYNNYEILDIRYVPSHAAQEIICNKNFSRKSSKPFKLYSITDMKVLNNIEIMFFELLKMRLKIICKLRLLPRRQYLKKLIFSGDSLFVALRKKTSGPLMLPTQEKYSVK